MFDDREWKTIYNNVFKVFPSPDNLLQKIILKTDNEEKVFKNSSELLSYLCVNENVLITGDIEYNLADNKLRYEVEKNINSIISNIKKREL